MEIGKGFRRTPDPYDVIIVGGGPAGLSAALLLARCRRSILLFDHGQPRNAAARAMHGFLSRDGIEPGELLRIGRAELEGYGVSLRRAVVVEARCLDDGGFEVTLDDGSAHRSRKLLLATGVRDNIPAIPGIDALYGASVHHCPYCDGWESRDRAIAVYGRGARGSGLALSLKTWSDDILLCTDGPARIDEDRRRRLARHGVQVIARRIVRLEGSNGRLQRIHFADGSSVNRDVMFFSTGQEQSCDLASRLGCRTTKEGAIWTNRREGSGVRGLYVAGDASRDVQFVIMAAAEGAKAAVAINVELQEEDRRRVEGV